jgi:amino acid transporter
MKRILLGRPVASSQLRHTLLPKWMALPVFSSDALSSTAYATQEMMLALVLAGAGAFGNIQPLALAVAALLLIVVSSYRQTVRAYPQGGGAYRVARENLGDVPGLTAAAALLIDYSLTVAVSVAAGVAAIVSAAPEAMARFSLPLALGFVALVTLANLRGVKEAGLIFALPTYLFIVTMFVMIGWGLVQCVGGCPQAPSAGLAVEAEEALTLFLLLRAFSSGATALTGVEAIADGVPAFRYPQSANAATTLAIMGTISVSMFLGISFLATHTGVVATEESTRTVNAEIALAVFGGGVPFYVVQVATAAILILAANTAYADFPRLSSILAGDGFLPRQFMSRGDRLVFSNGVLALTAFASLLLIVFNARVTALIQLYVVGVFTSFTLSQLGMVLRHRRVREPGWRRGATINGIGALTTGVVLIVVAITKFRGGAWIVMVATPLIVLLMFRIRRHYDRVNRQLRSGQAQEQGVRAQHVYLVIDRVDAAAAQGLSYAQGVGAASVTALAVPMVDGVEEAWREVAPHVPLRVVAERGSRDGVERLRDTLVAEAAKHPKAFISALVCEELAGNWLEEIREHRLDLRIKATLLGQGIIVTDLLADDEGAAAPLIVQEPVEHHVVVLVSGVHDATLRALAFARSLRPTSLRALSVHLGSGAAGLLRDWEDQGLHTPLEVVDSPFRSITSTVQEYVQGFKPDGRRVVVTCVLPDLVLPHWYQQPLHNQTALAIKGMLLFERGVVTTSIPYIVPDEGGRPPAMTAGVVQEEEYGVRATGRARGSAIG